jgi:hypothetical protein
MKSIRHYLLTCSVALNLALLVGCQTFDSMNQVRFEADPSPLDYIQFRRVMPGAPGRPAQVIRFDLSGTGYLEYQAGRSERTSDPFWQQSDSADWQDLRRDVITLTPEETTLVFQRVVDTGIFDRFPHKTDPAHHYKVAVMARVAFEKAFRFSDDETFVQLFDALLKRMGYPPLETAVATEQKP